MPDFIPNSERDDAEAFDIASFCPEREKGSHEGQGPRSDNDVLQVLHQTKRWGRWQLKGKETPRAMKTLQGTLARARKSPALRDILRPDYEKGAY
jgi:hypothetical protein